MQELGIALLVLAVLAIPIVALVLALVALRRAQDGRAGLEDRLSRMDQRLRALEGPAGMTRAPAAPSPAVPAPSLTPSLTPSLAAAPARPTVALEQRIGARWATWVGVLSLIITAALLLRWTFENNLIGPTGRVVLGLLAGLALLGAGLALRRRRDLPFLAEGLSGGGLAILYLSLFAANTLYGLIPTALTFALMSVVTASGIAVALASDRQATAVLAILGGILTPVLVATAHPDERVLLAYLLVLDALVLGVARSRSWNALNRLAWAGSVILILAALAEHPASPSPGARLALLSALAALFCAVPLVQAWVERRLVAGIDLGLIIGNAAAYFSAVYVTLEPWRPQFEGPWAIAVAAVYAALAHQHLRRVPEDSATAGAHIGNALVLTLLAFPLALDGPWVTLAWATQGAVCLWLTSRRVRSNTLLWGGLGLLGLAVLRVVVVDPWWYKPGRPVWNIVYAVHLLVVAALCAAGWIARRSGASTRETDTAGADLRSVVWFAAVALLTILLWREPSGLWPAGLLMILMIGVAWLVRVQRDRAFLVAAPFVSAVLLVRLFIQDFDLAQQAAAESVNGPLLLRIAACAALALAGRVLVDPGAGAAVSRLGRLLRGSAGVTLLATLSIGWLLHQGWAIAEARTAGDHDAARHLAWKLQVGLSVLWTLYAAAALAWGFMRRIPAVRYAALGLLGIVVLKVFLVDLAELQAIYRILSFFVLGLVLLGVSYVYQRLRPEGSSPPPQGV